jgi:hypothetical protein
MPRYWLTPPELDYLREGRFDPTPYPHSFGDPNALLTHWKKPWYMNPPFDHPTKYTRKAIEEGGPGTIVLPVPSYVLMVIEAGARLESLGRVRFLDVETGGRPPHRGIQCIAAHIPPYTSGPPNVHD